MSGHSACFLMLMACGATFYRELEYQIGEAIGKSMQKKYQLQQKRKWGKHYGNDFKMVWIKI